MQEESLTDWPEKFLLLPIRTDCLARTLFQSQWSRLCHFPSSKARHAREIVINRRPEARVACEPRKGETGKRFNATLCVLCQGENNTFGAPAGSDKDIFEIDLCSG